MAEIVINEYSSDYSYATGNNSYCTVALPITASWGPAFEDPTTLGVDLQTALEASAFSHFASSQDGLESFVSTYRSAATNWRSAKDYSYQMAITLLTAGYDLDVCRVCPGAHAEGKFTQAGEAASGIVAVKAKYPGTFGNNLVLKLSKPKNRNYWNLIVYTVDSNGTKTAVENKTFVFDIENSTDTINHISEMTSNFVKISISGITTDDAAFNESEISLAGGTDRATDGTASDMMDEAIKLATERFAMVEGADSTDYVAALTAAKETADTATASKLRYLEWVYNATMNVLELLTDKLTYNCNRIILPGWDDQNISEIDDSTVTHMLSISPLHAKLMEVAYDSRCATAYIDVPKCLARAGVYNDSTETSEEGYAQKLSRYLPSTMTDALFNTHAGLFAPWGQYQFAGTAKQFAASPSFLALMIERKTILNQSLQYEWALPTSKSHNLSIGSLDYIVPKKLMDEWQSNEGASVNIIADIPNQGIIVWGDSTLYEVPEASWNALQSMSTRKVFNAVRDQAYKTGLGITFQYNNDEAYSKFYTGVSPFLDTIKSLGAIEDYKVKMSKDINGNDSVNYNSVVGKIYLTFSGVINDITIDLVALPSGTDLSTY